MRHSTNDGLLVLLILYIRAQEPLYINYHEGFIDLADWLAPENLREEAQYPAEIGPDICCECLAEAPYAIGARVRRGCPTCQGKIPWKDKVLHTIWEYKFCEILNITNACFDYHLAHALQYISRYQPTVKENRGE